MRSVFFAPASGELQDGVLAAMAVMNARDQPACAGRTEYRCVARLSGIHNLLTVTMKVTKSQIMQLKYAFPEQLVDGNKKRR